MLSCRDSAVTLDTDDHWRDDGLKKKKKKTSERKRKGGRRGCSNGAETPLLSFYRHSMSPAPLFSGRAELSTAASVSSILEYANSWQCVCLLVLDLPLGGRSPTQLRSPICSLSENTCYPPTVRHPPPIPLQRISSAARLFRGSLDEMGTAAVGGAEGGGGEEGE